MRFQDNLISLLNTSCLSAETKDGRITSVTGYQQTTQCYHKVEADYFADCSGDSILALLAGADFRIGREEKDEFGETLAQDAPDRKTMGLSCILQAREYDTKQEFIPPEWANKYPDDDSFPPRCHILNRTQNFWWLELGGNQDSIADTETLRDELLKDAYGIWDHIKNHGDHDADNWALDWVGILPGKRESRRCIGDYILNEKDVLSGGKFDDIVAYGGWPIDDHNPDGFRHYGRANLIIKPEQPYGIPLRSLYSRNISNLLFAGRNISATHTALSSTRVMATCALIGQAVGTTVYHAASNGNLTPREACSNHIRDIQKTLLDDDCYLPGLKRQSSELTMAAELSGSAANAENLRNGVDRSLDGDSNAAEFQCGDEVTFTWGSAQKISRIRLIFDSDLDRDPHNMRSNYRLSDQPFYSPETLVKDYSLLADGVEFYRNKNNYQRLVNIPADLSAAAVTLKINATSGSEKVKVFSMDII